MLEDVGLSSLELAKTFPRTSRAQSTTDRNKNKAAGIGNANEFEGQSGASAKK